MNFLQFQQLFSKRYIKTYSFRKIVSAKFEYVLSPDEMQDKYRLEAYDGNKMVASMKFSVHPEEKVVYVNIVIIQKEYRDNAGLSLGLLKNFKSYYDEYIKGYEIQADFANDKLSETFKRLVEKGYFPKNSDGTTKLDMDKEDYDNWEKQLEMEMFEINRLIDLNTLPQPYMRIADDEKNNFFGADVIYKNLSKNEINMINDASEKLNNSLSEYFGFITSMFISDKSNIYYGISADTAFMYIESPIKLAVIERPQGFIVYTSDLNLINTYYDIIQSFTGSDLSALGIVVNSDNDYLESISSGQVQYFNSLNDINEYLSNPQENVASKGGNKMKQKLASQFSKHEFRSKEEFNNIILEMYKKAADEYIYSQAGIIENVEDHIDGFLQHTNDPLIEDYLSYGLPQYAEDQVNKVVDALETLYNFFLKDMMPEEFKEYLEESEQK